MSSPLSRPEFANDIEANRVFHDKRSFLSILARGSAGLVLGYFANSFLGADTEAQERSHNLRGALRHIQMEELPITPKESPHAQSKPQVPSSSDTRTLDERLHDQQEWRKPREITGLYESVAEDLRQGRPLVIATHLALLTPEHVIKYGEDSPDGEQRLFREVLGGNHSLWAGGYGHQFVFDRGSRNAHLRERFIHRDWKKVVEQQEDFGNDENAPLRTVVYEHTAQPNAFWRSKGVTHPLKVYHIYRVYYTAEPAVEATVRAIRQDNGVRIELPSREVVDTGKAQLVGFAGHNPFFDYVNHSWNGIDRVDGVPSRPKGTYAIGCQTAKVGNFPDLIDRNVQGLLFTTSNIWGAGFNAMSLIDSVLEGRSGRGTINRANDDYQHFLRMNPKNTRVGRPFVGHAYGLF